MTTVFSSSSEKWSLLTVTHEISHKIVKAVLSIIFPTDDHSDGVTINKEQAKLLFNQSAPNNWLDALRIWLWESITQMSASRDLQTQKDSAKADFTVDIELIESIDDWYGEVEEIIVHVFDLLYFYRSEDEQYLREIWMTWSVIPNISNRVPEYVVRSVCAVLAKNFHRNEVGIEFSIDRVKTRLNALQQQDPQMPYIGEAINYIDTCHEQLIDLVTARRQLVRFVKTFLYSETIASKLWVETRSQGGEAARLGYGKHYRVFDEAKIDNPLLFLDAFSTQKKICEAESAWIFYNLAFNLRREGASDE